MRPYNLRHQRFRSYNWEALREAEQVEEITLHPNEFVSADVLKSKLQHQYYNEGMALNRPVLPRKLATDTLLWYGPECPYPPLKGQEKLIAGLYLKNVIPPCIQKEAFDALHEASWQPLHKGNRPEVRAGKERQAENVAKGLAPEPGELSVGYQNYRTIQHCRWERDEPQHFRRLGQLLRRMDRLFEHCLPEYHELQNQPITWAERVQELKRKGTRIGGGPQYGGIPWRFRVLMTSFSSIAILRSCPTAVHTDHNATKDQLNFSCITSVTDPAKPASGGTFALIEYGIKIPIGSGDILIAQTSREYHTNIGKVEGEKYSFVCYYKTNLPSMKLGGSLQRDEWKAKWTKKRLKQAGRKGVPGMPQTKPGIERPGIDEFLANPAERGHLNARKIHRMLERGFEALDREDRVKHSWSAAEDPGWYRCVGCLYCHRVGVTECPTMALARLIKHPKQHQGILPLQDEIDEKIIWFLEDLYGFGRAAKDAADALGVTVQYVDAAEARYCGSRV